MSKVKFYKVISIVIALLMLIPVMPNAFVGAEVNNETAQTYDNGETMTLEAFIGPVTTPSGINAEQDGKLNIDLKGIIDSLNDLGYKGNATIIFENTDTGAVYTATAEKNNANFKDADLGRYTITITAGDTEFIVNAEVIQEGKEAEFSIINNEFTFITKEQKTPTIHFRNVVIVEKPNPSIKIEKTGTFNNEINNDFAEVGETISYVFLVTNTGNVTLTNIKVTDEYISSMISGDITELQPGKSTTFTANYSITEDDINNGEFYNKATVTAKGDDKNVNDTDDDTVTLNKFVPDPEAKISLSKEGTFNDENGNGFAELSETISYKFTVTNTGNVTLTNIKITDEYISSTISGDITELQPGKSTTFIANYSITEDDINNGEFYNKATVTAKGDDKNVNDTDDDTVTLNKFVPDPEAKISLSKEGTFNDENDNGFAEVGETISYKFTVTNIGNVKVTGITLEDPKLNSAITGGASELESGASTVFTAAYTITEDDLTNGQFYNIATATGKANDKDVNATDDDTVTLIKINPGVSLLKEGTFNDENENGYADVGETITYKFTVTNTGNVKLAPIVIEDPKIKGEIVGNSSDLDIGAKTILTGIYEITNDDINVGKVDNTATVKGYYSEVDFANAADTETVTLKKANGGSEEPEDPEDPEDPKDPDDYDDDGNDNDGPGVTINDPDVPLDGGPTTEPEMPENTTVEELIEDAVVPLATLPDTGDFFNNTILFFAGAFLVTSGIALNKKKKIKE